jgi:8-oxo-dGTP pyrophosphatase MutT (NUDIX family)
MSGQANKIEKYVSIVENSGTPEQNAMMFGLLEGYSEEQIQSDPETLASIESFMAEQGFEYSDLKESSEMLQTGLEFEYNDIKDTMKLTGGKFKNEIGLYLNDGGTFIIKVVAESDKNKNGFVVSVNPMDGESILGNKEKVVSTIKNAFENGDLRLLENDSDENEVVEEITVGELFEMTGEEALEAMIHSAPVEEQQSLYEAICDLADGKELTEDINSLVKKHISQLYETEIDPEQGFESVEEVSVEEVNDLVESGEIELVRTSENLYQLKESKRVIGIYNRITEKLHTRKKLKESKIQDAWKKVKNSKVGKSVSKIEKVSDEVMDEYFSFVDVDGSEVGVWSDPKTGDIVMDKDGSTDDISIEGLLKLTESAGGKSSIIENFIKSYADEDMLGLLDMKSEINDIFKDSKKNKKDFIQKIKFGYPAANESDIEDFYTSLTESEKLVESSIYGYIETFYKVDENSPKNDIPFLGSDGSTVLRKPATKKDIENHISKLKNLKSIKPFLFKYPITVRVKKANGDVVIHKTVNLNESADNVPMELSRKLKESSNKVLEGKLVLEALEFLGYKKEQYEELKKKHGGKDGLIEWINKELAGKLKESEQEETPKKEYADVILMNENDQVLFLERSDDTDIEPNTLGLAGGKVEEGETPEEAAKRELLEETGMDVEELELVRVIENEDGSVSHYFKADAPEVVDLSLSEEHTNHVWMGVDEIKESDNIIFGNNDRFVSLIEEDTTGGEDEDTEILEIVEGVEEFEELKNLYEEEEGEEAVDAYVADAIMEMSEDETEPIMEKLRESLSGNPKRFMNIKKRLKESASIGKYKTNYGKAWGETINIIGNWYAGKISTETAKKNLISIAKKYPETDPFDKIEEVVNDAFRGKSKPDDYRSSNSVFMYFLDTDSLENYEGVIPKKEIDLMIYEADNLEHNELTVPY